MKNEIKEVFISEEYLKNKIYIIRGQKVMLDSDLAMIYGYSTKDFNRQVKNNIEKFPNDFMFRLTKEEFHFILRCKFSTSKNENFIHSAIRKRETRGGSRFLPYVFSESGIYMLMTVLKGPLAIKQSIMLIRLFKGMKDTLNENGLLPSNILRQIELKTIKHDEDIKEIRTDLDKVMENFIDPGTYKEFLILNGKKLEADKAYESIFKLAKKSIIYIDDYINLKTLSILSLSNKNIDLTLISDNKAKDKITSFMINDFISQNPNNKLTLLKNNNICHDRFIILDFNTKKERIYHCGASLKDAGNKITTIIEINDTKQYTKIINELLNNQILKIK